MVKPPLWIRLLLGLVLVASAAYVLVHREYIDPRTIVDHIDDYGWWMPVAFVLYHIVSSLFFVPRAVMAVVGGLLFGFWMGSLWTTIGSLAGAVVGFLLARVLNAGTLDVSKVPKLGPFLVKAERGGWRAVMVARLLPIMPNTVVNYAIGMTNVPLGAYVVGSLLGMLPQTLVYVNLGATGRLALNGGTAWLEPLAWGLGLLALSFLLPKLFRRFAD